MANKPLATKVTIFLGALTLVSQAAAAPTYFLVTELPGHQVRQDSYILPLTADTDIAYARQLIAQNPAATSRIVFARIAAGGDGINGDYVQPDTRLWSWHVTQFLGFGELGIEILDGWPGEVEQNVDAWILNTGGEVGFWNYTVTREFS